jgi:D-cysteine desulfhydrase
VATRVVGVAVCDDAPYFVAIVERIAVEARERFGLPALSAERYRVLEGLQGRGYGLATAEELASLTATLRRDGLMLDPVYTNKAFLGLSQSIATLPPRGADAPPARVVFIHTGGIFGLSAFASELVAAP